MGVCVSAHRETAFVGASFVDVKRGLRWLLWRAVNRVSPYDVSWRRVRMYDLWFAVSMFGKCGVGGARLLG